MTYATWHTRKEKREIEQRGGTPLAKYGTDGILNGHPVEVRCCRKDDRFRIDKDTQKAMVAGKGTYIFVNSDGKEKSLPAKEVSQKLGNGHWFKDRDYPHKFLRKKEIFE